MAEPAERTEPEVPETVTPTGSRFTFGQLRSSAMRWGESVEAALARLTVDALSRESAASSVADASPAEGLSTGGLDPDEDASWRERYALSGEVPGDTGEGRQPTETKPARAPTRWGLLGGPRSRRGA